MRRAIRAAGAFIGAVFKVAGIIQTFLWLGGSIVLAAVAGTVAWVVGLTNAALLGSAAATKLSVLSRAWI